MPRENKKRGRRAEEKKRKLDTIDDEPQSRKKPRNDHEVEAEGANFMPVGELSYEYAEASELRPAGPGGDQPFFGMLDEEEQEYFKRADDMLELNQFNEPEERSLFLANVYREAEGKELKIAHSQSCSRLMERLVLLSTPAQLKNLFQKFSGQYVD